MDEIKPRLPAKQEWVVSLKLSERQIEMYKEYKKNHVRGGPGKRGGICTDFQQLGRVCTHHKVFRLTEENRGARKKEVSDKTKDDAFSKWVNNQKYDMTKIEDSGKLIVFMDILSQCESLGHKVLVFNELPASLKVIEQFLVAQDKKNKRNRANSRSNDVSFTF